MGKRVRLALAFFVVALVGSVTWQVLRMREPVYQGKPLSEWLEEARQSDWVSPESEAALQAVGNRAVPALLRMVEQRDSAYRKLLAYLSDQQDWVKIHVRPRQEIQDMAVFGFRVLGAAAKPAVGRLMRLLDDDDAEIRDCAAHCLGLIGPGAQDAVPRLVRYLRVPSKPGARQEREEKAIMYAMYVLGKIGPPARSAVPQLRAFTNDPVHFVRDGAEAALIGIGAEPLSAVVEKLKDPSDLKNWNSATFVVRWLGTNAEPAVPVLLTNLQHTNCLVQDEALQLLGSIRSSPEQCIPAIAPLFQSTNARVRADAIQAICALGSRSDGLVPEQELQRCLVDPEATVQSAAKRAFIQLPPKAFKREERPFGGTKR